jgi:hypothetical protein
VESPTHDIEVTASLHQNNNITIDNDGKGGITITADGTVRNFTGVHHVTVDTLDGNDRVTYNQGRSGHTANLKEPFVLDVGLGDGNDKFTANVFGNVGFADADGLHNVALDFAVFGGSGNDTIAINANHDTDIRSGSIMRLDLVGGFGNDKVTVDYRGELDGRLAMNASGGFGNDVMFARMKLDDGSTGIINGLNGGSATLRGDFENDNLTFKVNQASGAHGQVDALIDGGISLFDNDVGHRTANVRSQFLEHDFVVQ